MKFLSRVVIDTNVFVAGIFWSGHPYRILNAWQKKKFELILSMEIFEEYTRVFDILSRKYPSINLASFTELISREAKFFEPFKIHKQICTDPDDDKFIAVALSSKSECIISGDKALLAVSGCCGVDVLKPNDFVKKHL